jgi:hypothetical protein
MDGGARVGGKVSFKVDEIPIGRQTDSALDQLLTQ